MKIDQTTAKKIFPESPAWFQDMLKKEFGEKTFELKDFEKIRTFSDACLACGTTEEKFNKQFGGLGLEPDTIAFEKLKLINSAINSDWKPDYTNTNQYKWYPYFLLSSGLGFVDSYCTYVHAHAYVGSRLCFESEEKANYSGSQFNDIWKTFLTGK